MFAHVIVRNNQFLNEIDQKDFPMLLPMEYPADENNLQMWKDSIVAMNQKIAQKINDEEKTIDKIVHIYLDGKVDQSTHKMLGLICKLFAENNYKIHIVWLCDKFSKNAGGECEFLECIIEDVKNKKNYDEESKKIENQLTIEYEKRIEEEREQIFRQVQDYNSRLKKYNILRSNMFAERDQKIDEEAKKLEIEMLKTRWHRFSILFDTTAAGGQGENVEEMRSAAAVGVVRAAELIKNEFELRCYGIKKSSYSVEEYGLIPAYVVYKNILQHRESYEEIKTNCAPEYTEEWPASLCVTEETLTHAFLLDDNNYSSRRIHKKQSGI